MTLHLTLARRWAVICGVSPPPSGEAPTLSPQSQAAGLGLAWGSTPSTGRACPTPRLCSRPGSCRRREESGSSGQRGRCFPFGSSLPSGVGTQSRHLGHPQRQPRPQGWEQLQDLLPERKDRYQLLPILIPIPLDPYPGQRTDGRSKGQ